MPSSPHGDSTRYVAQGEIGRGGMGSVERVFDRARGGVVARKRILDPSGVRLLRFKAEFRVIEQLHHPSLVRLYELGQDAIGPFFTMELIDGVDLATYCGRGLGGGALDEAKLRHVLPQLLGVLAFLHARGIVHCDLKPSNVMVRKDGVLKLLDFGVLSRVERGAGGLYPGPAGTPAYMAPEVADGGVPTPASDLYSLGVVLDDLYTGRRRRRDEASPLRSRAPHADARIGAVVDRLTAIDPARRATLDDLYEVFGLASRETLAPSLPRLVGRDAELGSLLDDLGDVFDGAFAATALSAASGVGKSALVRELARVAERAGAIVLRSRAHLRERLAFNGLDEAVDELARAFLALPGRFASAAIDAFAARAAALFPALLRWGASSVDARSIDRGAAFVAFVDLLEAVAARGSALVLVLDDLQWIDADAAALLAQLLARRPTRVFLLATLRDDLPSRGAAEELLASDAIRVRRVPLLEDAALAEIARTALASSGGADRAPDVAELVRLADGRPMLVELAARALSSVKGHAASAPLRALEQHLASMDEIARNVVAALFAFDGWMDDATLSESVGATGVLVDDRLNALERQGIVRIGASTTGGREAEISHDLVRTAAAATLPHDLVVAMHARIGDALAARPDVPEARVVRHLFAGGRGPEASTRARLAMQRAYESHAYDLAIELAAIAAKHPEGDLEAPLEIRARALDASGRYAEAAEAYAALAASSPPRRARSARTAEATALLSSGDVARGRARAETVLSAWGGAVSRAAVRARAGVRFLLGPRAIAAARARGADLAPLEAEREERLATMAVYFDPLEGLALLQRAQRKFDRAGAYGEAAFGDFLCAYWALFAARKAGDVPLAARYLEAGSKRLARAKDSPLRARGMPVLLRGVVHQRAGRRDEALAAFTEALRLLSDGGAEHTFDAQLVSLHPAYMAFLRGDVAEAKAAHARLRATMRGAPANALACHERLFGVWMAKLEGRFDDARAEVGAILAGWPDEPTFQRVWVAVTTASIAIYAGDAAAERRRVALAMTRDARFRVLENLYAGMLASWLALLDVRALRQGDTKVTRSSVARWAAIAREAPPMGTSGALRAMAYMDEIAQAPPARVIAALEEAEAIARASGELVDAAIARYQRGVRLGGADGAQLEADAREALARLGASARLLDECPV